MPVSKVKNNSRRDQGGFILIELITVIVLIGIIASFTGFFLYTGFKGYLTAKANSEGALSAQMAMDRISLELRDLDYFASLNPNVSLTYKSAVLTGTRILKYDATKDEILLNLNNVDYPLINDVSFFKLSKSAPRDLNNDGVDEVAYFEVGFRLGLEENDNAIKREFNIKIFPRNMIKDK